jgi:hypothetical protein
MSNLPAQAANAASSMLNGKTAHVCDVQPGNGTRYLMLITSLDDAGPLASLVGGIEDKHVLSLPYFKTSYPVNLPGYFTAEYTTSKWTNGNDVDGAVVADFLNQLSDLIKEGV